MGKTINFQDRYDIVCSLSVSGDRLLIGCDTLNPQQILPGKIGWHSIKMPVDYVANNKMQLNVEQIKLLLPHLMAFVRSGELKPDSSDMFAEAMAIDYTGRGFSIINFADITGRACSLQKSSLATEDAIWFGCDDAEPYVMEDGLKKFISLPKDSSCNTRMHLTISDMEMLLPILIDFSQAG